MVTGSDEWLLNNYEDKMERIRYDMRRIQVGVMGMTCAACSNYVGGALMGLNSVVKAYAALLQNKTNVTFDPYMVKANAAYGMTVHDNCKLKFLELKANRTCRFIVFYDEEKQKLVVTDNQSPLSLLKRRP